MPSLAELITALPQLNSTELKTLRAALDKELIKYSSLDKDLYFILFQVTGEKPIEADKFAKSELGLQWRKNQSIFNEFLQKLFGKDKPKQIVLRAVKKLLMEILVEDIKNNGQPLNAKQVCYQLGNIEAIFERAYPGYLRTGLGHLIVKQLEGNHG